MLSIVSWPKSWSPQAMSISRYLMSTFFWYATVRIRAI